MDVTLELQTQQLIFQPERSARIIEHVVLFGQRVQFLGSAYHIVAQLCVLEAKRRFHGNKGAQRLLEFGVIQDDLIFQAL